MTIAPTSQRHLLEPSMNVFGALVFLIALSACAEQKLTQSECVVAHESGFMGTPGVQERITVAQNGGPCIIGMTIGRVPMGVEGQIKLPPAHGTASIRATADATFISYTPARDFAGDDRFEVMFGPNFSATVLVRVVPLTSKSTAAR